MALKLAVIVTDARASIHIGGSPETVVKTFELPKEVVDYIEAVRSAEYTTVVLATTEE